ncbi:MAG: hypothetical protein SP1CHLAM54_07050 [Chlamydiia bacterium]|nr:hypothetical protein [Chlamydiia bacterium]MCH9615611.1 hypothetical protein [Chlamydiia bacterium]MCH9628986.1 hypothetical protein [Chlamydiia bacterium]
MAVTTGLYKDLVAGPNETLDTMCVIDQEDFLANDQVTQLACKHIFRTANLTEWARRDPRCPTCRAPFAAEQLNVSPGAASNQVEYGLDYWGDPELVEGYSVTDSDSEFDDTYSLSSDESDDAWIFAEDLSPVERSSGPARRSENLLKTVVLMLLMLILQASRTISSYVLPEVDFATSARVQSA